VLVVEYNGEDRQSILFPLENIYALERLITHLQKNNITEVDSTVASNHSL